MTDDDLIAIGLVAREEGVRLGHPMVGDHGEEVVGQVECLAVGEDARTPQRMGPEDARVGQVAVVGGVAVVRNLAQLHEQGIYGQQRDDPEEPEERP